MRESIREHLAWLMWCYDEGYRNPRDRVQMHNWLLDDDDTLHPDDVRYKYQLLTMAEEILGLLVHHDPVNGMLRIPMTWEQYEQISGGKVEYIDGNLVIS